MPEASRGKSIGMWVVSGLLAALFVFAGAGKLVAGDVGTNDLHFAATQRGARFSDDHCQGVGFLPR